LPTTPNKISYLNGKFLPHEQCLVHIEDRGFQFADGVYEVTLFKGGKLIDANNHLQRLFRSLRELNISHNFNQQQIIEIQQQLIAKNNLKDGICYLNITRGVHKRVPHQPITEPTINAVIDNVKNKAIEKISVITHEDLRWLRCDIKSVGLCYSSMIKQKALDLGFDDAILTRQNIVTEATYANVFMVDKDDNLVTRMCDNLILCGITRNRIINLAQQNNIKVIEKKFDINELKKAKEVFLSSSGAIIKAVTKIDEEIINDGKIGTITKKIFGLYYDFINIS